MALKTLVKAGSISNLSDARYCAGMGVDYLGFRVIAGQAQCIPAKTFQEIRGWVTGPQIVAEIYGIQTEAEIKQILEDFKPDCFELGLEEWQRVGNALSLPFMLALKENEVPPADHKPDFIILTSQSAVSRFVPDYQVLLKVKTTEDLAQALGETSVSGVCLTGTQEISPGLKTYDELADILEALEED